MRQMSLFPTHKKIMIYFFLISPGIRFHIYSKLNFYFLFDKRNKYLYYQIMQPLPGDYYQVLGLPDFSPLIEIKKAYRKLALQFHPDRNKDRGAKERFQLINNAYSFLSSKKNIYDQLLREQKSSVKVRVVRRYSWSFTTTNNSSTTAATGFS